MGWTSRRDGNARTGCLALVVIVVIIAVILPDGSSTTSRSGSYGGTPAPAKGPSPTEVAKEATVLKVNRWWKDGLGVVMMLDVSVTNGGTKPIKDIEIACEHYAPSGTKIDTNRKTLYERVAAGTTRRFREVNMGFIAEQAQSTRCEVVDLVVE